MRVYLYITLIVGMAFYLFWDEMPPNYFFYGNALFILMLSAAIYLSDKKSFIRFYIFSLSLSNFVDEINLDNTQLHLNELILLVMLPIIWHFKNIKQWLKNLWNNITYSLRK